MQSGFLLVLMIVHVGVWERVLARSPETCTYDGETCEWKYKTFQWSCPEGKIPVARAFWGRDPGDNSTCVDQVPSVYLQNLNCPGDDSKAAEAVTNWCANHVRADGMCRIRAARGKLRVDGKKYDPCVGTFKYLRVCRYCTAPRSAGYTCTGNNPCTEANIKVGLYYYPHVNEDMYIQCDDFGGCFDKPCAPTTIWSQKLLTCVRAPS